MIFNNCVDSEITPVQLAAAGGEKNFVQGFVQGIWVALRPNNAGLHMFKTCDEVSIYICMYVILFLMMSLLAMVTLQFSPIDPYSSHAHL
jgi:hypothetical protein